MISTTITQLKLYDIYDDNSLSYMISTTITQLKLYDIYDDNTA